MKRLPLRHKLLLSVLLLFLAAADLLGLLFLRQMKTLLYAWEAQSAANEAAFIASHIADDWKDSLLWNPALTDEVRQGTIVFYSRFYEGQGIRLALSGEREPRLEIHREVLHIVQPLPTPFNLWSLDYRRELSPCSILLTKCSRYFWKISLIITVVLLTALYFLTRYLTRPLSELTAAARKITNGQYDIHFTPQSDDELAELNTHFSVMSRAVQTQLAETRRLAEDKQQLVGQLAHELRTPLTSICGFSELLLHGSCTEDERMTALTHIYQQAVRIQTVSSRLLEQEKIRANTLRREWFEAAGFLAELQGLWAGLSEREGVAITAAQDGGRLFGDRLWLQNLVLNLVENAVHATPRGGVVSVTVSTGGARARVEVLDHGCGIPQEAIPHLFEPFFRVRDARPFSSGGNGLGLPLCRTIAQAHGGEIAVHSSPGKGACFTVFLPNDNNSLTAFSCSDDKIFP